MQKKKVKREYAKPKKAFDSVMAYYRTTLVTTIRAVNIDAPAAGSVNPAKPTPQEFRYDVDMAIKAKLKGTTLSQFRQAYVWYDSEDAIEREVHAQAVLGSRRHSIEQRLGAEFIRRKLYPVHGRGYFHVVR